MCAGRAELYCVVDFNKSCAEAKGVALPLCGIAVYYHRCQSCGLIFTVAFDRWNRQDYARLIYNDDYASVDPDYLEHRPKHNAAIVANFVSRAGPVRILDYGGGNGLLAGLLREQGLSAESWDPMVDTTPAPAGGFDVVSSFEVFEHTPTPIATCAQALAALRPDGVLLFSTLTVETLTPHSAQFWYVAPRNGHVTIYTKASLERLFARFGCRLHHFSDLMHLAYRTLPAWVAAAH